MKKLYFVSVMMAAGFFSLVQPASACSNLFIAGPGGAAVARTMDLEMNTGNALGFGAKGWQNTSNINAPQSSPVKPLTWTNQYAFAGQTGFGTYVVLDGINSAGVYAGFLDLPNATYYPIYNPHDPRPELGLTDIIDYVLGTASSVPDALTKLAKVQLVQNAFSIQYNKKTIFFGNSVHLVIRDKAGNSAVIEWTKDEGKSATHIYSYTAGSNQVVETIEGSNKPTKIYKNTLGAVLTNAPTYGWQLTNAARFDKLYSGNTNQKRDGIYMNGSGLYGLPGDWTPPSRFARATQLVRLTPKPETEEQALALAYNALSAAMVVPVSANPASTIWESVSDLPNSVYYFKPIISSDPFAQKNTSVITLMPFNTSFQAYDVKQLEKINRVPSGWVAAKVAPSSTIASTQEMANAIKMAYTPTAGKMHYTFALAKNT